MKAWVLGIALLVTYLASVAAIIFLGVLPMIGYSVCKGWPVDRAVFAGLGLVFFGHVLPWACIGYALEKAGE